MHTEEMIRQAIRPLLEHYGILNTSEVKEHLPEVLNFDEDDLLPSPTRQGEFRILQRIGNIVSHQKTPFHVYPEGFAVDKTNQGTALFIALNASGTPLSTEQYRARQHKAAQLPPPSTKAFKKIDWNGLNERRTNLGKCGELFALYWERERVQQFAPSAVENILHLSETQGDGFGYDILSLSQNLEPRYIEVKTTTEDVTFPFFMSVNEKRFFESDPDHAYIYRVYNFDQINLIGNIHIITGQTLLCNYLFAPQTFMVKPFPI